VLKFRRATLNPTGATPKGFQNERIALVLLATVLSTTLAQRASAQFGLGPIKRPNIANIFHPVVGQGAAYDSVDKDGKKSHMEMYVVDKEMVGTEQGYWMEVGHSVDASGNLTYGKMLVTPADFKFHRMIFVMPGQTHPMQIDMDRSKGRDVMEEQLEKWHSVGERVDYRAGGDFFLRALDPGRRQRRRMGQHLSRSHGPGEVC